jgi:hypothetical protein
MTYPGITFPRVPDSPLHFARYLKLIMTRPLRSLQKEKGYHIHHIVPKCLKGSDDPSNLIKLTYREHYLAHCLLALAFTSVKKLGKAINCFKSSAKNSRVFQLVARHEQSDETKVKIGDSNRGKPRKRKTPMSDEEKQERAERCRNREWEDKSRQKLRDSALANPTIQHALAVANRPDRDRTGLRNGKANPEVWNNYELLKKVWVENGRCGVRKLFSLTGIGTSHLSLRSVVKKFKEEDDIV